MLNFKEHLVESTVLSTKELSNLRRDLKDSYIEFGRLDEAKAPATKYVSKGIYTESGRKIQGERQGKYGLYGELEDGTTVALTWNQYKKIKAPTTTSKERESDFTAKLIGTIHQFNRKVDVNMSVQRLKKSGGSFEDIVDIMLHGGAKYTKRGLTQ